MEETTSINFGIQGYENVRPNSLNTEQISSLINQLPNSINADTFSHFCKACQNSFLTQNSAIILISRLAEYAAIDSNDFSNFCNAAYGSNFLKQNSATILLSRLAKDAAIDSAAFSNFCYACDFKSLTQDSVTILLNRLEENVAIDSTAFSNFCCACDSNSLTQASVTILLNRLEENAAIDSAAFSNFCYTCDCDSLTQASVTILLSRLQQGAKMHYYIDFYSFCDACQTNVLNQNNTIILLSLLKKNFSFSKIDQNKFPTILSKFHPDARSLVVQKMQKDLTRKNKKGLGVGIFLTLAGIGTLISPFTFGASSLLTILLIAGGGAATGIFGGISIFNGAKIFIKNRMVNNALKQVEIETSEDSNSTKTYDEEEINQKKRISTTERFAGAIDKSSDTGENNIIPKNQEEEEDKSDPEI